MEKIFRKPLFEYFHKSIPKRFGEMMERKPNKIEVERYKVAPLALFSFLENDREYFVSIVPVSGKMGQFFVECGWKRGSHFPVFTAHSFLIWEDVLDGRASLPGDEFVIRLFFLCKDRGTIEEFWNLYASEVWDKSKEGFREFARRVRHQCVDTAAEIASSGGPTEEFVRQHVALVGGDVMECLECYGIPFLRDASRRHQSESEG